ncbi:MAG: hypothetical protein ABIP51_19060 [Bacteroidia bacterium]
MIKKLIITCALLISVCFQANSKTSAPPKEFFACWKASYEENDEKTKTQVYRPCTNTFRPSMFRLEIEFFADGKCKFLHAGETDAHYYVEGKWSYNKKTKAVTVTDDKGVMMYKFKIKEAKKDGLKIISLN